MNEKKICACVGARTRDTQKSKEHYEENFIPAGWNLEYTCLDQPEAARALYLTGVCLHCGGQLGKKFNIPGRAYRERKKAGKGNTKRRAAGYRVGSYKAEKSAKNKKKSL